MPEGEQTNAHLAHRRKYPGSRGTPVLPLNSRHRQLERQVRNVPRSWPGDGPVRSPRVGASKNARRDDRIIQNEVCTRSAVRWWIAALGRLQFFVHSPIGNSTNTSQPGPATRA
jgi:hypothetical protein